MAISSKRILTFIAEINEPFTHATVLQHFSKPARKKKTRARSSGKEIAKVEHVLSTLAGIGYLIRKKGRYRKNPEFSLAGKIRLMQSGMGVVKIDEGLEVVIAADSTNYAHSNDLVQVEITSVKRDSIWGRVTKVVRRSRSEYMAKIDSVRSDGTVLTLLDIPGHIKVFSQESRKGLRAGDYALVTMKGISGTRQICSIGSTFPSNTEDHDVERISLKHSLPEPYDENYQLDEKIVSALKTTESERRDYRKLFTVTIDGDYAKDFDDAISLEKKGKQYLLYVHIADVSSYVARGSALDGEAYSRGTSYYLGNRVIPMLPEVLSNNLCSLVEGEDRYTLTAELVLDAKGTVKSFSFHRGIIRVNKRLTYKIAHGLVTGKAKTKIALLLREMHALAAALKASRMRMGRVDLTLSDQEVVYDGERAVDIRFAERLTSHLIIEEFMLSANEAASKVLRENNVPTLYRIHEDIAPDKLYALKGFLASFGISVRNMENTGVALQEVVDGVAGREYQQVVNFVILKSFMQAYYGEKPLGHFGLGFRDYTHFTSPIRRYPDLIVHRCITALVTGNKPPYSEHELQDIGAKSSEMERVAQNAERDLIRLKSCRIMEEHVGETFDVVVSGISKSGMYVSLIEKPIEGFIPLRVLTDDYYLVNEDEYSVTGKRLGRRFRLGDIIKARLIGSDISMMRIDFEAL